MQNDWEDLIAADGDPDRGYLSCDEFDDVEVSLKMLIDALDNASRYPAYWKWVIVSCHSALQSACVCILTRTDGSGALEKQVASQLSEKLYGENEQGRLLDQNDIPWPEARILPLDELLKSLPGTLAVSLPGRKSTSFGWDEAGDLRRLCEFRNKFLHFPPTHWSLEIAGLPRIVLHAVERIEKIVQSAAYQRINRFSETLVLTLVLEIKEKLKTY